MKKLTLLFLILFLGVNITKSQTNIADYANPQDYVIGGITISGTKYLDKNTDANADEISFNLLNGDVNIKMFDKNEKILIIKN